MERCTIRFKEGGNPLLKLDPQKLTSAWAHIFSDDEICKEAGKKVASEFMGYKPGSKLMEFNAKEACKNERIT